MVVNTSVVGPWQKAGYGPDLQVNETLGVVLHDAGGSLQGAFGELRKLDRRASWYATIDLDGTVYKHYDEQKITWHCGSLFWNCRLIGIEHVSEYVNGKPSNKPVTGRQRDASVALVRELSQMFGFPLVRGVSLFEHNEVSIEATGCPSGRMVEVWDDLTSQESVGMEDKELRAAVAVLAQEQAGQIKALEQTQVFLGQVTGYLSVGRNAEAEAMLRYVYTAAGIPWPFGD